MLRLAGHFLTIAGLAMLGGHQLATMPDLTSGISCVIAAFGTAINFITETPKAGTK